MRLRDANGLPRVVVTGSGSLSCLGHGNVAFFDALRAGRGGLRPMAGFAALGLRARVGGPVDLTGMPEAPRKLRRFFAPPGLYAWHAANEAFAQAGVTPEHLRADDCGLVFGGGAALSEHEAGLASHRAKGIAKLSPFWVPRGMSSALSASLAHAFDIGGTSLTLSSACTSATHAIGHAMELIQLGRQQMVVTGGAEELHDSTAMWFDAMGALSPQHDPALASRPCDRDRDGFVLAAGAGVLVLESLEHAHARGATVLAELAGYGNCTDAASMVGPGADGIARAMRQALDRAGTLPDYINTHACSTPQGDLAEWQAIRTVFAERGAAVPPLSSIKGLTGHAPGAAGALDAIAGLLMMQHDLLVAGRVVDTPDPDFADAPLLAANRAQRIDSVLSNSFGFGGSCASLLFRRYTEDAA
ncbi:beta-ketoacyl-[acyl-carrier-protein] synthase family protein [Rhodanobacter glycinis]|uniref:3-oxoacyl-[acyl-carrier-protein] synthase 1 n=1 Tax=Rhodanobacter glycinis TaxID=582702 RepID=A0A1I4C540_9GAMM|nr:beta-ketoacyl-[acyl-carrier-protein] synthase family protein [Rhodanobacter glycinis]SFK75507.1 3-oxoacyl-[acyl-carrier-protein] synthase-1 [Rhodanobacter glycinis]